MFKVQDPVILLKGLYTLLVVMVNGPEHSQFPGEYAGALPYVHNFLDATLAAYPHTHYFYWLDEPMTLQLRVQHNTI